MVKVSDAEFEVLKIIWDRGEATSNQIIQDLKDFPWNPNTIRTLIKRLHTKGAIEIINKESKAYTYRAIFDEEKYKNEMALDLLKKFYNGSIVKFILEYCEMDGGASQEEMKKILKTINDNLK